MGELIIQLIPVTLGVVLSPLAIMALIAILVSPRARVNGATYMIGWALGLVLVVEISAFIFVALGIQNLPDPPTWVSIIKILLGIFMILAAIWIYRRGRQHVIAMTKANTPQDVVAAAPQLPGWLQTVSTFTPFRSGLLGLGLFVLNPVDATCAILAALTIVTSDASPAAASFSIIVFAIIGILPIAAPVLYVLFVGDRAQSFLNGLRDWVATHTSAMNAGLVLVIGALQLENGLTAIL